MKGTTRGTTTLGDGSYSIQASARDVLVFSLLGYAEQEVAVNNRTRIDVTLEESASAIDEVVIEIGYGGQARKDITGTLSSVKMEDLVKAPVMNFDQALQGRLAGVSVSSSDGQPGAEMDIVIRGANSLTQSNAPLYVIDGFPIEDFSNAAHQLGGHRLDHGAERRLSDGYLRSPRRQRRHHHRDEKGCGGQARHHLLGNLRIPDRDQEDGHDGRLRFRHVPDRAPAVER